MKKHLCLSLLLLAFGFEFVFAQGDKDAVKKVLYDQSVAWNKGDIPGFMQGYWKSDSLVFVGKTAPTYGWQTTLDHYKKGYPDKATMGLLNFDIVKIEVLDKTNAFVLGGWHLKRDNGDVGGYFTLWFKKINGAWVIVCDHTS